MYVPKEGKKNKEVGKKKKNYTKMYRKEGPLSYPACVYLSFEPGLCKHTRSDPSHILGQTAPKQWEVRY